MNIATNDLMLDLINYNPGDYYLKYKSTYIGIISNKYVLFARFSITTYNLSELDDRVIRKKFILDEPIYTIPTIDEIKIILNIKNIKLYHTDTYWVTNNNNNIIGYNSTRIDFNLLNFSKVRRSYSVCLVYRYII